MIALLRDAGLLNLASALVYATALYGFFRYLSRIASAQANKAISSWIQREPLKSVDLSAALVSIFDRLYSAPLLHPKAFLRSALLTIICTILVVWYAYPFTFFAGEHVASLRIQWSCQVAGNIAADFVALFLVRRLLVAASPVAALLLAPVFAAMVVGCFTVLQDVMRFSIQTETFDPVYFLQSAQYWWARIQRPGISSNKSILLSGLVVYAWLPMFAISVATLRGAMVALKSVKMAQWFLKAGRQQPLHAVGLVASVLVFLGVTLGRLVFAR